MESTPSSRTRYAAQSISELVSARLYCVRPGTDGSSGMDDKCTSRDALKASGVQFVRSRIDLGRVLNSRGPRMAKEFARAFLTEGADEGEVFGTLHSLPRLLCVAAVMGVWSRFGAWPSRIRQVYSIVYRSRRLCREYIFARFS